MDHLPSSDSATDTTPDAQDVQDQIYRRLGATERVGIAFRLSSTTRQLALAGIRARHPEYTDLQAMLALARALYGEDVVKSAWPDQALVDP